MTFTQCFISIFYGAKPWIFATRLQVLVKVNDRKHHMPLNILKLLLCQAPCPRSLSPKTLDFVK